MTRTRVPSKAQARERLAAQFAKTLNISIEEAFKMLPPEDDFKEPETKLETEEEKILEAQAVLTYYRDRGANFIYEICRSCKEKFAYSYNFTGVKYCSIVCIRQALREIGLDWRVDRPLEQRYGRYVPAVVPAVALALLDQDLSPRKDVQEEIPALQGLDDLLSNLPL